LERRKEMLLGRFPLAAVVGAATVAALAGILPTNRAVARQEGAGLSVTEFKRLHDELDLGSQPWATIPWKVSVTEARLLAAKEKKPIFLVVNTGKCLGCV
jgi:hypothetical protein